MTVNLSALAGAGAQFFDNNGVILSGGKLYSYAAGTTTPQTTYTSASGATAHTNPIILNSAGRVATGEIWLTTGSNYKFVLYTSTDVLIATWDNITGINGTGIATAAVNVSFTGFKGQTGTVQDLADDDGSDWIGFKQAGTNAVARSAQDKMRESVSVKDFGAIGDGVADDTAAIQAAIDTGSSVFIPSGTYKTTSSLNVTTNNQQITGGGNAKIVGSYEQDPVSPNANESMIFVDGADNVTIKNITLEYTGTFSVGGPTVSYGGYVSCIQVEDCDDFTAENVIAYGANRSGINVGYMLTGTPPYCARPKIFT